MNDGSLILREAIRGLLSEMISIEKRMLQSKNFIDPLESMKALIVGLYNADRQFIESVTHPDGGYKLMSPIEWQFKNRKTKIPFYDSPAEFEALNKELLGEPPVEKYLEMIQYFSDRMGDKNVLLAELPKVGMLMWDSGSWVAYDISNDISNTIKNAINQNVADLHQTDLMRYRNIKNESLSSEDVYDVAPEEWERLVTYIVPKLARHNSEFIKTANELGFAFHIKTGGLTTAEEEYDVDSLHVLANKFITFEKVDDEIIAKAFGKTWTFGPDGEDLEEIK